MNFYIADTFTDALAKLDGQSQKLVRAAAFEFQLSPTKPSFKTHRIDASPDQNFWSARVNRDIRLIVHKTESQLVLCYVDHHDKAYAWAERRRLDVHPTTHAAQFVVLPDVALPGSNVSHAGDQIADTQDLFSHYSDEDLLTFGIPVEWIGYLRSANEDRVLEIAAELPQEAAEAVLQIAAGDRPHVPTVITPDVEPFLHPDAQRRFRIMHDSDELARALDYPWEKWAVFLHPEQRKVVEREWRGAVRVSGSAGTGKTIVALHRAAWLAEQDPDARILLSTFSAPLATALKQKLRCLLDDRPRLLERIEVEALPALGWRLYRSWAGNLLPLPSELEAKAFEQLSNSSFSSSFLLREWRDVIDAWQLDTWESYRDVARLGRKRRLTEAARTEMWTLIEQARTQFDNDGYITESGMFNHLYQSLENAPKQLFSHVIVDEAQDLSVAQLRFLAQLCSHQSDGLFFAGDIGQRIFQAPFSWRALGVDIRGRSRTLKINYRTSHQIRQKADLLLESKISDVDGNEEARDGTVSMFSGPTPSIHAFDSAEEEVTAVAQWISERLEAGIAANEIALLVRDESFFDRALAAIGEASTTANLSETAWESVASAVNVLPMHLAKGLEFRSVAIIACDDDALPLQSRVETVDDSADLEEVFLTERHLLYVACTRARDELFVSGVEPISDFLDDLSGL